MIKEKNILMFNFNEDISDSIKRIFKDCKECIIDIFTNYNLNSKHTTLTSMDLIFVFIDTHDINKSQNGIDFIKKISSDEKISACIIAVANNAGYEFMALEAGALDYFIYPFNEEIFKLKIRNMISINSSTNILKNNMFFEKYDLLTRVYNRSYFIKKSEEVIKNNNEKNFIIIKTHVSNLKVINQFFNIEEGDKFLCHFAKCIDEVFRDENDCIYGRTEGDKFTICLPLNETTIKSSFKKLKNLVKSHKFNFDYVITYGIYIVKNEKINVELFCDKADIALRAVIGNYINKYAIYNQELHEKIEKEQKIINRMKKALKSGEFQVYFQSQHNIKTNEIVGAEALVRWIHPTDGLISPGEFIPIFESNGFILKLDYYVWEQTCIHIRKWLDEGIDLVPFSVNVSRINLLNPKLCDNIIKLCEKYSIPSKLLQLELTESAYTESPAILQKVMQKLQSKGYKILMDDFGSGYSSLNMLKDIAVDTLKLDLHFLSKDSINGRGANILTSIIRMAKGLDLPVVAEGVETALQAEFLKIVDCDFAQGYLFSRPMP
ncbi:MAG: EAL domain-containing protein, partial [Clostridia bacterium]